MLLLLLLLSIRSLIAHLLFVLLHCSMLLPLPCFCMFFFSPCLSCCFCFGRHLRGALAGLFW